MRAWLHDRLDGEGPEAEPVDKVLTILILLSALTITLSTVPTLPDGFKSVLQGFELVILTIFVIEYVARIYSAPRPLRYILSFWGLIDLVSILPALLLLAPDWQALRAFRLLRLARLLKLFRADKSLARMARALTAIRGELLLFGFIALVVTYLAAVGIYHFERFAQPDNFGSIPESLWWAVATLTTVGYGDVYPVTTGGQIFTAFVLLIGLGVVAVPAGLVTAALLDEFQSIKDDPNKEDLRGEEE